MKLKYATRQRATASNFLSSRTRTASESYLKSVEVVAKEGAAHTPEFFSGSARALAITVAHQRLAMPIRMILCLASSLRDRTPFCCFERCKKHKEIGGTVAFVFIIGASRPSRLTVLIGSCVLAISCFEASSKQISGKSALRGRR